MNRQEPLDRFDLKDDAALDKQIETQSCNAESTRFRDNSSTSIDSGEDTFNGGPLV